MMVEEKEEKSFAIIQIPPKFSWSLASSYTWTSASSWKRKEKVRTEEKLISNDKLLKILWLSQYRFNLYLKDFFLSFPTPLLLFYKKMSKTINIKKIKIKLIFLKKNTASSWINYAAMIYIFHRVFQTFISAIIRINHFHLKVMIT